MQTIVFALEPDQHFFIVFEHAELFNAACANRLLKSLEEPFAGYHFILLAQRTDGILATIRSRCLTETITSSLANSAHPLLAYFTPVVTDNAAQFVRELERARMAEREIQPFLDELTDYWYRSLLSAYEQKNAALAQRSQKILDTIEDARSMPVMPGSSKIVLRNLYLCLSIV